MKIKFKINYIIIFINGLIIFIVINTLIDICKSKGKRKRDRESNVLYKFINVCVNRVLILLKINNSNLRYILKILHPFFSLNHIFSFSLLT